jgi:IclR family transcriptional regulator, pca regulon regulatory protein
LRAYIAYFVYPSARFASAVPEFSMPRSESRPANKSAHQSAGSPAPALPASLTPAAQVDLLTGDPNFMTSLARGLVVIQAFSERDRRQTISQLSVKTGLSRAAVRRCLYTLMKLGFAGTDDSRHFYLRPRVLTLGHAYISSMPLASAAQPVLEHLSHLLHESSSIATLEDLEIIYVARASATRIMSIDLGVGSRLPAFCTSMGRVLLANLPPEELESCLARIEYTPHTDRTVSSADKLRQVLRSVQRNGYAIVDQELELGLRSMAVPIRNPMGKVVAALNVGAHAQRVTIQDLQNRFLSHLQSAAQEFSMLLR